MAFSQPTANIDSFKIFFRGPSLVVVWRGERRCRCRQRRQKVDTSDVYKWLLPQLVRLTFASSCKFLGIPKLKKKELFSKITAERYVVRAVPNAVLLVKLNSFITSLDRCWHKSSDRTTDVGSLRFSIKASTFLSGRTVDKSQGWGWESNPGLLVEKQKRCPLCGPRKIGQSFVTIFFACWFW